MIAEIGFSEVLVSFGCMATILVGACVVGWLGYCITSVARAADALERIADALEDEDAEDEDAEEEGDEK